MPFIFLRKFVRRRAASVWVLLGAGFLAGPATDARGQTETPIAFGSDWKWRPGTNEASSPVSAWRLGGFDDSAWSPGIAPISYGTDSSGRDPGADSGTIITGMVGKYNCIFIRKPFVVTNVAGIQAVNFTVYYDDGFVAWINGTNVLQQNMPTATPSVTNFALVAHEADPAELLAPSLAPQNYLVEGTNWLAVQLFNNQINSSDLRWECQMQVTRADLPAVVPPPEAALSALTQISVTFSQPVTGVTASALLINGLPAASVTSASAQTYVFHFTQPPPGLVAVAWNDPTGITDLKGVAFAPEGAAANWSYSLADASLPQISDVTPAANARVSHLEQVQVQFDKPVQGVVAADLLVNGQPAASVTGFGAGPYLFTFSPPSAGPVQFTWAAGQSITDYATPPNAFAGGSWTNTLDPAMGPLTVWINEFLAGNKSANGLRDQFGNLEDWIELFNYGTSAVDLTGCALTDDAANPDKWVFPPVTLGAGQYLVVFASGRDLKATGGTNRLHTSFSLGLDGEYLGLYDAGWPRAVIQEFAPAFPPQRDDYSYGLDAAGNWVYFATPTPGGPNGNSPITGTVEPVHFSVSRGVFKQPFNLVLTCPTPNAVIRYTLNGALPTASSGTLYTGPVTISGQSIVRAAAFALGRLPSPMATHTYIFPANVLNQPPNPIGFPMDYTWLTPPTQLSDYGMDQRVVTNADYAPEIEADLLALPALSIVAQPGDTFGPNGFYQGFDPVSVRPEKPCSAELIFTDGSAGFQIDCGVRVRGGGSSRSAMKHPLDLKFRGQYGAGKLHYQFFPDSPVKTFDSLVLRADYNNHWVHSDLTQRARGGMVRDPMVKDVQTAMGDFSSRSRYMHLYINGLYWGVYNICEDIDDNFAAAYLGGQDKDCDVLKASTEGVTVYNDAGAYNAMMALNNSGLSSLSQYNQIRQYLDVTQFADYFMLQSTIGNMDWGPSANWGAMRRRTPGDGFKFLSWDSERSLESSGDTANQNGPLNLQANLAKSAEYCLLFADRVHRHFFNNGPLTTNGFRAIWDARARQIYGPIVCESARWGDTVPNGKSAMNTPPYPSYNSTVPFYSRNENWLGEQDRIFTNYLAARLTTMMNRFRSAGLYPSVVAPEFNQPGGRVAAGFSLAMTAPAGTIYYTTNGVDPRVYGTGEVSPQAMTYSRAVTLSTSVTVKARALNKGTWSALDEADFIIGQLGVPLRIVEIMYNPPGGNAYEFIELQNLGTTPLDLSGYSFDGITYIFPNGAILQPGAVLVLGNGANPAAFAARYPGVIVAGYYSGNLDNAGERIAIYDRNGRLVTAVTYAHSGGWPSAANGDGYSLEIIDPNGDPDSPANWRASYVLNGTPGLPPAALAPLGDVVLNEIMAENASTITNGGKCPDWVELHNRGSNTVSLADWSLSNGSNPRKFVFPANTSLAADGYLVVWCDSDTNAPGLHTGFALSKSGDNLLFYDAATNRVDGITFGLQIADFSIGRIGDVWQLNRPTPGTGNLAASLTPPASVGLNEWLANSPPGAEDWIELYNRAGTLPVALGGLYLSTSNGLSRIAALSFLPPHGYAQFFADEVAGAGHLAFKLSASGGLIELYDPAAQLLESVVYGPQIEGVSEGRLPDGALNRVSFPGSASPGAANYLLAWNGPVLNEVMAQNKHGDLAPWGKVADWVELYNPAAKAVNLGGMGLGKSLTASGRWVFPAGVVLPAGGYLRVWCNNSQPASTNAEAELNTGFGLNATSGDLALFNTNGQPVDSVSYGFQLTDQSIGRTDDGRWALLAAPTPGAANTVPAALGNPASLRINEWLASPASGGGWFELYNLDLWPVCLSGLYLTDDPSVSGQTRFQIAPLSFIGGQSWVLWNADGSPASGRDHVNFSLNNLGETIRLYDANRTLIDAVDFGLQTSGVSQGRLPDGALAMAFFTLPTPGASNLGSITPPVGSVALTGDGKVRLTFTAQPGLTYQVEYKTNLTDAAWMPLGAPLQANGSTLTVDDGMATDPQRFYRLVVTP